MPKIMICIVVRMKSTRLPQKAMLDIYGQPLIQRLLDRLSSEFDNQEICICTSDNPDDKILIDLAIKNNLSFVAGDELDVMNRLITVALMHKAQVLVRVTGDNPLTDPTIMRDMIEDHWKQGADYTFCDQIPRGSRSEVISSKCLQRIYDQLSDTKSSEYMTYMLKRPDKLKVNQFIPVNHELIEPNLSFTVDTPEDFSFIKDIYKHFNSSLMSLNEIISFCRNHPNYNNRLFDSPKSFPKISGIDYSFKDD